MAPEDGSVGRRMGSGQRAYATRGTGTNSEGCSVTCSLALPSESAAHPRSRGRTEVQVLVSTHAWLSDSSLVGSSDWTVADVQRRILRSYLALPDAWGRIDSRFDEHAREPNAFARCSARSRLEAIRFTRLRLRGQMRTPVAAIRAFRCTWPFSDGKRLRVGEREPSSGRSAPGCPAPPFRNGTASRLHI